MGTIQEQRFIVVKQLPVFEEHLHTMRDFAKERVAEALKMAVTEDTVKAVKAMRAELNKEYAALETARQAAKKAVMEPYNRLEAVYRDCVTDVYAPADQQLKEKIAQVEDGLRRQKTEEVRAYFDECCQAAGLDWLTFERAELSVTLSASMKSLKEQAKKIVEQIAADTAFLHTQPHAAELIVEYQSTLNVAAAVTTVQQRHAAIQREQEKKNQQAALRGKENKAEQKVGRILASAAPLRAPIEVAGAGLPRSSSLPGGPQEKLSVTFTVSGTRAQLQALKQFLIKGGYQYE